MPEDYGVLNGFVTAEENFLSAENRNASIKCHPRVIYLPWETTQNSHMPKNNSAGYRDTWFTSWWGIKHPGIFFGSVFPLFPS